MCEWDGENGIKARMVKEMIRQIKESPVDNWFYQNYYWNNSAENVTTETFAEYSTQLQNATEKIRNFELKDIETLRESFYQNQYCENANNIITDLRNCIIDILVKWGHTFSPANAEDGNNYNGYLETGIRIDENGRIRGVGIKELIDPWIPIIVKYIQDKRRNGNANITQILDIAKKGNDYRIASWSKLLAALEPGKFFIYDSRVAMALSNFCLNASVYCFWKIPSPRNSGINNDGHEEIEAEPNRTALENFKQARKRNMRRIRYGNADDMRRVKAQNTNVCYDRYHDLLNTLANNDEIQYFYNNHLDKNIKAAYEGNNEENHQARFTREQAIMAHIEKMLFMMKEPILDYYSNPQQQPQN